MDQLTAADSDTLFCARHPSTETVLRCGRCETPICPRCSITTPVGMRCRDCAQVRRPPMYDLRGRYLWQAIGAAAALVLAGGLAFNLLLGFAGRSILLAAALYAVTGIAIAELLSLSANRKRGPRLQALAAITAVLVTQSAPLLALVVAHRFPLSPVTLLLTAVAAVLAWTRLR